MSVLTSFPAMPNRIAITCEYLHFLGPEGGARDSIEKQLSPLKADDEEETSGSTVATAVISEMEKLQLIVRSPANAFALATEVQNRAPSEGDWQQVLRPILQERMSFPALAETYGQKELPDALAWLLTQDPFDPLPWSGGDHMKRIHAQLGDTDSLCTDIGNNSRYQNLLYWARYFGLVEWLGVKTGSVVIPDPSAAVARLLPTIFADEKELPASAFIQGLSDLCPLMDEGAARRNLETRFAGDFQPKDRYFSRSTSLAVKRLQLRGTITVNAASDAKTWVLDFGKETQAVSHFRYNGEATG